MTLFCIGDGMSTNIDDILAQSSGSEVEIQRAFLQRVYAWMLGGLLLTAAVSFWLLQTPTVLMSTLNYMWLLLIAKLALVWFLSARIDKISVSTATALFLGYSALNGITFTTIFLAYTASSITNMFVVAAAMFGITSAFGYITKRNLSGVGSFMFMGLIGIIVASLINIWLQSSALEFAVSFIGVVVFVGLTAWDTQKMKEWAVQMDSPERASKYAIVGALELYLDFVNLFIMLLRLFGDRR